MRRSTTTGADSKSSVRLEPDLAQPLVRAMMRAEAELLLEDADALGPDAYEDRTREQRAAGALVRLAVRMGDETRRRQPVEIAESSRPAGESTTF